MFCDVAKSSSDAYILSVISYKISDGLKARYVLYWSMLLDLVIGEGLVGRTLAITSGGTPSMQNLGPSGPQRIGFVLWNSGMLRQPVFRGTHWFTSTIAIRRPIGD